MTENYSFACGRHGLNRQDSYDLYGDLSVTRFKDLIRNLYFYKSKAF